MRDTGAVRRRPLAGIAAAATVAAVLVAGCGSGGGAASSGTAGAGAADGAARSKGREMVTLSVPSSLSGGELSSPHQLEVPRGWTASAWARPPGARMLAVTPEGDLLVSEPSNGVVLELGGGKVAETERVILGGLESPQGLAFARRPGGWLLYVGESDQIDAYRWSDGRPVGPQQVIAPDLPDEQPAGDDIHRQKDVVVAPNGDVYFDVGSSSNASPADRGYDPPRGVIDKVEPEGGKVTVVMQGVRNGEGLALAPDGTVWTAVNNRDEIAYPFHGEAEGQGEAFGQVIRSYVDNHPPDEVVPVSQGRDLGWPYCNPEQGKSNPPGSLADVPLIPDAENNPSGAELDCAKLEPIEVGLPAHTAPLGMSFLERTKVPAPWSGGAVVAAHGSWDRQEPRPPAVLWMRWDAGRGTLLPATTLVSGFQEADGERWGRPVDVVPGPEGSLFVSDDAAGAIYKLTPPRSP
ncbi:MAG: gluconolaconase [Actinobacteria bacterium]|nr:gluconolaconase [Actinomycetota bacterium]